MPIETVNVVVTGANPRTISVNVNVGLVSGSGTASVSYQGATGGEDTAVASGSLASSPYTSNDAYVAWQVANGPIAVDNPATIKVYSTTPGTLGWPYGSSPTITGSLSSSNSSNSLVLNQVDANHPISGIGSSNKANPMTAIQQTSTGAFASNLFLTGTTSSFLLDITGDLVVSVPGIYTLYFNYANAGYWAVYFSNKATIISATNLTGGATAFPSVGPATGFPLAAQQAQTGSTLGPPNFVANSGGALPTPAYVYINFPTAGVYPFEFVYNQSVAITAGSGANGYFQLTYLSGETTQTPSGTLELDAPTALPVTPVTPPAPTLPSGNLQLSITNGSTQVVGGLIQLSIGVTGIVYSTQAYIPILEGTAGKLYVYSDPAASVYNFQIGATGALEFNGHPVAPTAALGTVFEVAGSNSSWQGRVALAYDPTPTEGQTINGATGAFEVQYNGSTFDSHVDASILTFQAADIAWYDSADNSFDLFTPTLSSGGTINQINLNYMVNPTVDAVAPYVSVSPTSVIANGNSYIITITLPKPMSPEQQGALGTGNVVESPTITCTSASVGTITPVLDGSGWLTGWTVSITPVISSSNISASLGFTLVGTLTYLSGDSFITGSVTYVPTQAIPLTFIGEGYTAPTIASFAVSGQSGTAPNYSMSHAATLTMTATVTSSLNDNMTCAFYRKANTGTPVNLGNGTLMNSYTSGGLYYKVFQLSSSGWTAGVTYSLGAQATDTVSSLQSSLYYDSSTFAAT
jgi:hypothetical protein